ncbi:MAG: class I SAM-dependent methyltransferase [Promethearchaeota archaeon]
MPEPGHEHDVEIGENYIDNLMKNWPHSRDQLHNGGWKATKFMVKELHLDKGKHLLDLCCGEGGTARWLARTYHRKVTGIDILEKAIAFAQKQAILEKIEQLVTFVQGNVFKLPFPDNTFDIIYGQDPDGIAHHERVNIFRECWRVLHSGGTLGFQHWILQNRISQEVIDQIEDINENLIGYHYLTQIKPVPQEILDRFDNINAELGFSSMKRLTVNAYLTDLLNAGFRKFEVIDLSEMYEEHMRAMEEIANAKEPGSLDTWTKLILNYFDQGYKIGVMIKAFKI